MYVCMYKYIDDLISICNDTTFIPKQIIVPLCALISAIIKSHIIRDDHWEKAGREICYKGLISTTNM